MELDAEFPFPGMPIQSVLINLRAELTHNIEECEALALEQLDATALKTSLNGILFS